MSKPKEREYVYITEGCIDARDVTFKTPDGIEVCGLCGGNGKRQQWFCDIGSRGARLTGGCDLCKYSGFHYVGACDGVPISVTHQIAVMNGLSVKSYDCFGLDWTRTAIPGAGHAPLEGAVENHGTQDIGSAGGPANSPATHSAPGSPVVSETQS